MALDAVQSLVEARLADACVQVGAPHRGTAAPVYPRPCCYTVAEGAPRTIMPATRSVAGVLLLASAARAFYLPGVAVREYQQDERVDIKVNKLTSTKTQYAS